MFWTEPGAGIEGGPWVRGRPHSTELELAEDLVEQAAQAGGVVAVEQVGNAAEEVAEQVPGTLLGSDGQVNLVQVDH